MQRKLFTKSIETQLRQNRTKQKPVQGTNSEIDFKPVVKLFNPCGAATWLLTELDDDGDTLFGLCDLGMGSPELGSVSLSELSSVKGPLGLGIERDRWFTPDKTLSEYADEARRSGRIVA